MSSEKSFPNTDLSCLANLAKKTNKLGNHLNSSTHGETDFLTYFHDFNQMIAEWQIWK